jgi:hypothetical protein
VIHDLVTFPFSSGSANDTQGFFRHDRSVQDKVTD